MDKIAAKFLIISVWILFIVFSQCTYTIRVKDGLTAFELKQYAKAIPLLKDEFRKEKDKKEKAKIAAAIAQSYEKSNQHDQAPEWWEQARNNHSRDAYWQGHIESLIFNNRLDEAEELLPQAMDVVGPVWSRKKRNALNLTKKWLEEPEKSGFTVKPIPEINTAQADFAPFLMDDQLVFASDRKEVTGSEIYEWTDERYMDLFSYDPSGKTVNAFEALTLNSEAHEGYFTMTQDKKTAYFVRCAPNEETEEHTCQIYSLSKNGENWSEPERLPFQDLRKNYTMPAPGNVSGTLLFFVSDDRDGWGGLDIYFVQKAKEWNDPRILPRTINSEGNEAFPFIENDTLYFSSDGQGGMGGYDIYRTYQVDNKWQPAHNLKAPLNSVADDMSFVIDFENSTYHPYFQKGYFVSNRKGGKGKDDIYRFERVPAIPDTPEVALTPTPDKPTPDVVKPGPDKDKPENERPKGMITLQIRVKNNQNNDPIPNAGITFNQGNRDSSLTTDVNGIASLNITSGALVEASAQKTGFLRNIASLRTDTIESTDENVVVSMDILLEPIEVDQEIILENIYYDFDKWDIRPDAEASLNDLASILNQNPGMVIRLNSYTDCRGSDRYNQILSQKRADSAVDYLKQKGIDPDRLKAKGFGELSPVADCRCTECTEEEHQLNRRTSFTVLEL